MAAVPPAAAAPPAMAPLRRARRANSCFFMIASLPPWMRTRRWLVLGASMLLLDQPGKAGLARPIQARRFVRRKGIKPEAIESPVYRRACAPFGPLGDVRWLKNILRMADRTWAAARCLNA